MQAVVGGHQLLDGVLVALLGILVAALVGPGALLGRQIADVALEVGAAGGVRQIGGELPEAGVLRAVVGHGELVLGGQLLVEALLHGAAAVGLGGLLGLDEPDEAVHGVLALGRHGVVGGLDGAAHAAVLVEIRAAHDGVDGAAEVVGDGPGAGDGDLLGVALVPGVGGHRDAGVLAVLARGGEARAAAQLQKVAGHLRPLLPSWGAPLAGAPFAGRACGGGVFLPHYMTQHFVTEYIRTIRTKQ